VQLKNERRAHVRLANQITEAWTTHYIPSEKQVCATVECYMVQEALAIGVDHHTPCQECSLMIQMNVSGF